MPDDARPAGSRARRRIVTVGLVVLVVAAAVVGSIGAAPLRSADWVAQVRANVEPTNPESSRLGAYQLDVLSRKTLMPTFAALVGSRRVTVAATRDVGLTRSERDTITVTTTGSQNSSLITVEVAATKRSTAVELARAIRQQGTQYVNGLGEPYQIRAVDTPAQVTFEQTLLIGRLGQIVVMWSIAALMIGWVLHRGRRSRLTLAIGRLRFASAGQGG